MELKQLKDIVIETLKQFDFTRGDDDLLYLNVLIKLDAKIPTENLIVDMRLADFFTYRKRYGFPSFESVSRCRRKAQEEHPELRPRKQVQEARKTKQDEFYKWSQLKQQSFDF
jgi:hypothetical protein